jgi:beta-glucanase (GH16 family)
MRTLAALLLSTCAAHAAVNLTAPAASQADLDALTARVTKLEQGGSAPSCANAAFCDDFNSLSLQNIYNGAPGTWMPSSWYAPNNAGYVNNSAWFVNPFNPATPNLQSLYATAGSILSLGIQKTPASCTSACGNQPYVQGQIITNQTFLRGYFEAKLKVPVLVGSNFAFWTIAPGAPWPPEIDMVEIVQQSGQQPFAAQSVHYTNTSQDQVIAWNFDISQWHTFGADWQATQLCFYIDRKQTGCFPTNAQVYQYPMAIILSTQQGGSWSGPIPPNATLPAAMQVDYVAQWPQRPF